MKTQMLLKMFPHISKQTVGHYERETGAITMFFLLPAKAKVEICIELLQEKGDTRKAIDIIDYLQTLSKQRDEYAACRKDKKRTNYVAWEKDEELTKAYTNAKYRVGYMKPVKVVTRKTV